MDLSKHDLAGAHQLSTIRVFICLNYSLDEQLFYLGGCCEDNSSLNSRVNYNAGRSYLKSSRTRVLRVSTTLQCSISAFSKRSRLVFNSKSSQALPRIR